MRCRGRSEGRPPRRRAGRSAGSSSAEAPAPPCVLGEGLPEMTLAEVRPERVHEDELRVRELPEEEVRDAELPGGADQEIRLGHLRCIETRGDRVLVDVARIDPLLDDAPGRLDELGPPAVVEGDPEREPLVVRGLLLEAGHAPAKLEGGAVAAADEARGDPLPGQIGQLALDRLDEDLHERVHLFRRPRPVLRRESEDAERLDPEIDRGLDRPAERLRARAVARGDGQLPPARPTAVPVHDDRDRARDVGQAGLGDRAQAAQRSQASEEAHTSRISASLRFRSSSIFATWSSVSFWTRSSARRSSSSPTSPFFTSSLRSCMTSRRTLRTATRPSSARWRTTFTSSFRRSSVSCGIGRRMSLPSFEGVRPRSDSRIARSIDLIELGSYGWTVMSRASGTLMVASC